MTSLPLALDLLLIVLLLALAAGALASTDLRRGVVLFIAFGLLLALVWARLGAPDVALAEAAIGAGLSGALLLAALRDARGAAHGQRGCRCARSAGGTLLLALLAALGAVAAWPLLGEVAPGERLGGAVRERLADSGVSNPVTAVLLSFRAYDTLLELAVLLAALLGILALGPARPGYLAPGPVVSGLTRWLVPLLVLVGGYLLWVGAHAPGGAFQAGALIAAAGVLLHLTGSGRGGLPAGLALRLALVAGVATFTGVGLAALLAGGPFLAYPPAWAGTLILLIEAAATLSIAATLVAAFPGGRLPPAPVARRGRP